MEVLKESEGMVEQVLIDSYAVVVPFVESEEEIFLKTAFPSRQYTSRYGLEDEQI